MSLNEINDHTQWEENGSKSNNSYVLSGKIMLSAIVILLVVVTFMIALHIYARWYLLRVRRRYLHRRRIRRQRATHIVFYVDPNNPNAAASASVPTRGLDASVLASLPVFVYSSLTHPDGLDCAVCLSEFENNEKGRTLPKCHHSFHTECIDMWFHSHSTCPICRAPVEAVAPVEAPQNNNRSELVVFINEGLGSEPAGSSSGVRLSCDPIEGGSMGTTSLADRRKGMDLVGVRIEVPRRSDSVEELRLSSPASHGYRSPGNRLQSLKRILSMNRKSVTVSPSSGIGPSCGSVGGELDVELGKYESTYEQTRSPTPR